MTTWYCGECAGPAVYAGPSLDSAHPLVYCDDERDPHGRTMGTADPSEAAAWRKAGHESIAQRRHRAHIARGRVPSCPVCRRLAEGEPVTRSSAHA